MGLCEIYGKYCPCECIFTHALCGVGVEYLVTLVHLPAGTDLLLLFLLIQNPKPFLTLADPVSPMQDVIYFP